MKYFRNLTLVLGLCLLVFTVLNLTTPHVLSLSPNHIVADSHGDACNGLDQLGGTSCGGGQSGIDKVVSGVVNIISYLAGIIAIIMVIISGIRYTTSGGDSARVGAAKTALVYALVGVAVAVLAQVLVHYVIGTATQ